MANATCSIDGCGTTVRARGLCSTHYDRWYRNHRRPSIGNPGHDDRFWGHVDVGHPLGCWEWTGRTSPEGYGRFKVAAHTFQAHRWSVARLGDLDSDKPLDHLCRNRACVNPDHLEHVTIAENTMRGHTPASVNAAKTHCKRGHEFTDENTKWTRDDRRDCRACSVERNRRYRARKCA